jgi:hypothetical protein
MPFVGMVVMMMICAAIPVNAVATTPVAACPSTNAIMAATSAAGVATAAVTGLQAQQRQTPGGESG